MKCILLQVNIEAQKQPGSISKYSYLPEMYQASINANRAWCERWGWDYKLITESRWEHPAFDIFQLIDYEEYDQIAFADSDFFFHRLTPDIFSWTARRPESFFASYDYHTEHSEYRKMSEHFGTPYYFNTGFIVIKKDLIPLIRSRVDEAVEMWKEHSLKDQGSLNWILRDQTDKILLLSRNWNAWSVQGKPLFSTHYAYTAKKIWSTEHLQELNEKKMKRISKMTPVEIEAAFLPTTVQCF